MTTPLSGEALADLLAKTQEARDRGWSSCDDIEPFAIATLVREVQQLRARVFGLTEVAQAVRGITEDLAQNGYGADCPFTSQDEAQRLLAIIDGQ